MFERICVPTDGSDAAAAAFDHILAIAADHGATVQVLHVADTTRDSVTRIGGDVVDVLEREGESIVEEAAARAADRGVDAETAVRQGGVPETVTAYAEEVDADLVAMSTRGRQGVEHLVGSTTERVVRQSPVPVLALRPGDETVPYPYEDILVPTDGSPAATAALDRALPVAERAGATVHVLSVVDTGDVGIGDHVDTLSEYADDAVAEGVERVEAAGLDAVGAVEVATSAARGIRAYVDGPGVDLVAMGTHGRTGVGQYLLGSVAERTLRSAPVPVLTVPVPGEE
ncbi:universal stress protein [Halorubrum ezzemoulense]|uniref:Universal stress protein n=1 Tax=Halorubrum ezzemoulense TaxID=337243 RepID=A0ABT4YZ58_HALEZ|nr:universal stress protein [Halorubrum ezzemoulense]MDB2243281.1 universal stress protein [Halorubrum ezzemoulense]MDB2251351.1 universal stress protein [Halorubrum ezzemoulense]MDB2277016.1 universal stress protein [Halorubrum ezzemoulense]MDB2283740.1 universal stress protein [Halorubrum ezzemoulense]MDB2288643.1 universal stress protein [Halorubrum ezzemoulense]